MNSRLLNNIIHTGDYNNGGITEIYLLDINDFISYRFSDDRLFDSCYVEKITATSVFFQLGAVDESYFTESCNNGIYKQELTTFIRTAEARRTADLLTASFRNYLVVFRNTQGKMYCFGSDGGASLSYIQQSGKVGEVTGYQVNIYKESLYPLFELNPNGYNSIEVLGTESGSILVTENQENTIKI